MKKFATMLLALLLTAALTVPARLPVPLSMMTLISPVLNVMLKLN